MRKHALLFLLLLVGILVSVLADIMLIHMQIHNYEDKIQILSVMADPGNQDRENMEKAAELLKGTEDSVWEGRSILESYGYFKPNANRYSLKLRQDIRQILLSSVCLLCLYVLAVLISYKLSEKRKQQEWKALGNILEQFQKRQYRQDFRTADADSQELANVYEHLERLAESRGRADLHGTGGVGSVTVSFRCRGKESGSAFVVQLPL